jgi:hypothetical protein
MWVLQLNRCVDRTLTLAALMPDHVFILHPLMMFDHCILHLCFRSFFAMATAMAPPPNHMHPMPPHQPYPHPTQQNDYVSEVQDLFDIAQQLLMTMS